MSGAGRAARFDLEALTLVSVVCGRVAHDLSNVLAAVDGYAEFVAQEVSDQPHVLADITQVRDAAAKGTALSRRLRQVGQLVDASPQRFDLASVVAECEEQVRLAATPGITVCFELAPRLPEVFVDDDHLRLALFSLVDNACDAMMDTAGSLTVTTGTTGEEVWLTVTDTGAGIPPDVLPHVFDPFFSTKARGIGNGLGLFIVQAAVQPAAGRVEITSRQGQGTTARVVLPGYPGP